MSEIAPSLPVASYTGTIRYPAQALLSLSRMVLQDLEEHYIARLESARERDDEEEECVELDNLNDVRISVARLDPLRYKAELEVDGPMEWRQVELDRCSDPDGKKAEESLITLGRVPKAEWVIPEACHYRRATRGVSPPDDPQWEREDTLLDFLEFLSKRPEIAGLFSLSNSQRAIAVVN